MPVCGYAYAFECYANKTLGLIEKYLYVLKHVNKLLKRGTEQRYC